MVSAFQRGLSFEALGYMTIGMIVDYITTYNNLHLKDEDKEDEVREATQSDYDNF